MINSINFIKKKKCKPILGISGCLILYCLNVINMLTYLFLIMNFYFLFFAFNSKFSLNKL